MSKKIERIQIKGMAKGYVVSIHCHIKDHNKVSLYTEVPVKIRSISTGRIHVLSRNNDGCANISDEVMKGKIINILKAHVQDVGRSYSLRKIPSEKDLNDTADLLVKQLDKKRREENPSESLSLNGEVIYYNG